MSRAKRARIKEKSRFLKKTLFVLTLCIAFIVAIWQYNPNIGTEIASIIKTNVKSYSSSTYVKNTFTRDNTKYVPIKLNDTYSKMTKAEIENDFNRAGLTIRNNLPDIITTGTIVETNNGTYTILIYGDVNCDGEVNVLDARAIVQYKLDSNAHNISGVRRIAANVDNENVDDIDVLDALRIVQFVLRKTSIIDKTPISDIENDLDRPEITVYPEEETIYVGDSYTKSDMRRGVTAEDNVDFLIASKIVVSGRVNTNTAGDYVIRYNATDSNGNQAIEKTRTVHVIEKNVPIFETENNAKYTEYIALNDTPNVPKIIAKDGVSQELLDVLITVNGVECENVNSVIKTDSIGAYEVKYTATNTSGNGLSAVLTKTIHIIDTIESISIVERKPWK